MKQTEEKLKILRELYKSDFLRPFPYQDCRKIVNSDETEFISSLDFYFSVIAGYCSWGNRLLTWSEEKNAEAIKKLQKSFFQQFPQFSDLKSEINDKNTPKLYNQMLVYELMRLTLIDILTEFEIVRIKQFPKTTELSLAN